MDNSSVSRLMSSLGDDATCYDVFLSFRGEDTRDSFTDHLYDALGRAGLATFRDNDEIDRGQELKPEIERAIKASKASIVVLSENYATSTWCLEELWLILEQRRECNHFLLPVFYHVDPSNVRKQSKTFKIQVETSTRWTSDNVNRWKTALTKVADLTGFVLSGPETKFLKEIVDTVYNELDCKKVHLPPDLIGMDTRYEEITSWLHQPNLEFLAICGMGGSGKTTLAKYIYNLNWKRFENMSFLEDIGTRCKGSHGLHELQEQLLKDILGGRKRKVPSVSRGTCKIEEALQTKRTLIVLDDIVEYRELVALLGTGKINAQSKIIITTENTDNWFKFSSHKCEQYKMKLLNDDESLELLSHHAFGSKIPVEGFKEVAAQAVRYCEGNPLGLGVLGSSLSNSNTILQWRSQLNLLEKDIHSLIQGVLMRSYMSLPFDFERELFLHIACFFIGKDMDYVVKILEPDYSAVFGIKTLINRCLLSVSSSNKLMMHRLLQETGRYIVRKEAVKLPEKRSRVWLSADSYKILRKGKGSKTIEGLTLDMEKLKEEGAVSKASNLTTVALEKMEKLKLLQLNFAELTGSHENFSEDLRWLCWFGFHLRTIPSGLFMGNLVALDMSYSNLEVFEPPMVLQSLQILNLKDSHNLLEIRNISMIPHLETLVLWNCHSLVRVCETIGELTSLALLNMTGCKHLCPREQINLLEEIKASTSVTKQPPFSFPHSLQRLFLKDCSLECTDSFPLSFCVQPFLQYLNLGNSLFELLPCYSHLKNLRVLDLSLCSRLKLLLCLPSTLAELYVYYCKSLEKITFQSHRFTLQEFGYEGCINLSEIEGFLKLVPIAKLDEADLGHLKWLKKYQSHEVLLVGDDELTKGRSSNLQILYEFDIMSTSLPHIKDLNTTPEYISESSSLSFDVPSCPKNRRLKGLNVTFKYTISGDEWAWFANISTANGVDLMYNPRVFGKPGFGEVGIWLGYWPIGNTLDVGDKVNVSIDVMNGLEVHECGASLVYTDDEIAEETMENNMGGENFLGGDLSGFRLSTGAYYLCRRDFFELMEVVGRLTPDRFGVLVGDTIDYTEVRGWRMTGRPKQLNPSFTELKTVRCIIHGPQLEEIYNIAEMSESSLVDKTIEFRSSSILRETIKSGTTSEISDAAAKDKSETYNLVTLGMSKAFVSDETTESASIPHEVKSKSKSKSVVTDGNSKQPPLIQASDNQVSLADFDAVKVVGKGNGGVVRLVQHKWTGLFFALKVIQMNVEDESARKQIAQELKINQSSQCPNVVACYQSFYDNGAVSIILEYMDGGSLADFLKTIRSIPEPYLAAICKQVLRGLWYLHHEKHIIHRDLKPSNLLINHRGEVKITDFGVSTILASTSGVANTFVGTYNYMSPERILGGNYDYKSDIWSLGLVLLECATGQFPYSPPQPGEGWVNVYELMETIVGQPPPRPPSDQFSPQFCSFIDACMQKDPKDRSSANELMSHPFINMFDDLAIDLASYFTETGSPLATSDIVAAVPNSVLKSVFGVGFVSEDFNEYKSDRLQGENTINHVGYSTAGDQLTVQERRHSL